ncbi:MAG: alpha/beta fold hydrolase [Gemmatimonadota bacterium]
MKRAALGFLVLWTVGCAEPRVEDLRFRRVDGPAGRLHVAEAGLGPEGTGERGARGVAAGPLPVVFVHSLAGSQSQWTPQLRALAGRRRAVALDLRGHGESELPSDGDYTVPGLARDVGAVVDALGLGRFLLVGHSLGGAVAAEYAGRHPERVAGLLLVDPVGDQRVAQEELIQFLFELDRSYRPTIQEYWRSILAGGTETTRRQVMGDLGRTAPEAVIHTLEGLLYFDPVAALAGYQGPTLSLITPLNDSPASLHRLIPGLRTVTVEGTSHWLQMDDPGGFQRILEGFLEEVEESA